MSVGDAEPPRPAEGGRAMTWVAWQGSTVRHAAPVDPRDARVGSFPLACGRWAPDGWQVGGDGVYAGGAAMVKPPCKRCLKAEEAR